MPHHAITGPIITAQVITGHIMDPGIMPIRGVVIGSVTAILIGTGALMAAVVRTILMVVTAVAAIVTIEALCPPVAGPASSQKGRMRSVEPVRDDRQSENGGVQSTTGLRPPSAEMVMPVR